MTTLLVILAFVLLDGVLRIAVIAGLVLFEMVEIGLWMKWRKKRSITGAETLVGVRGVAVTECRPQGQVRLRGQLWNAICEEGANAGDDVEVTETKGIRLMVRPL